MNRDEAIRATGINLYPEMNEKIVRILRIGDNPADLYAAALIEQLAADLAAAKEAYEGVQQEMDKEHDECMKLVETYKDLADTFLADLAAMTAERDAMRERAEAAEHDLVTVLKLVPVSICRKHCKRGSDNCTGWGECNPEWRGPVAEKEGV